MIVLKNRLVHSIIVTIISFFYGILFIFISSHIEFIRILPKRTANYDFWDRWRIFLLSGNIKYIGSFTILIGLVILIRTIYTYIKLRRAELDEYEVSILKEGMCVAGITTILLIPILLVLILSEPQYSVPYIMFFSIITWSLFALTSLYFSFRH